MKIHIFLAMLLSCFAIHTQQNMRAVSQFSLNASYVIVNSWPTGYQVTVTLNNNTSNPTSSWISTFTLGQGQSISSCWSGVLQANGQTMTVSNPTWVGGGTIPANASTTFGFIVQNPQKTAMSLNNLQAVANGNVVPPVTVPNAPVLNAIVIDQTNPSSYTVSWNNVANATSYTLQRDVTSNFTNPIVAAQGAMTSQHFSNQPNGTYFYRVSASNSAGASAFSNTQNIVINNTTPPVTSGALIEAYWESWNSADSISSIVNMHVDIINVAFVNFTTTGTHTYAVAGLDCTLATLADLVTQAHSLGKKVKISVGGATYPISPQLQTVQDAVGMAQALAIFIHQNNLDGVDFDIEDYPAPNVQIALLQNIRQLLGNNALISYTPKSPASTTSPYEQVIQGGYQYVDAILIMAYDYAQGYTYQEDVQALMAMGVPASKINVGLLPGVDDVGVTTTLADITTAAQYIKQNNLNGIMFWDLNRDLENQTGLGASAATNAAWNVFH